MYYLPTIKNPLNLTLLSIELIHSPHILPPVGAQNTNPIDLSIISFLIDGFEASAYRKASITDPTLTPIVWMEDIYKAFENLRPEYQWRAIAPMAGLIKSIYFHELNQTKNKIPLSNRNLTNRLQKAFVEMVNNTLKIYGSFSDSEYNKTELPTAIYSLSITLPYLDDPVKKNLIFNLILPHTTHLTYLSSLGLSEGKLLKSLLKSGDEILLENLGNNPVFVKLNTFSFLIQECLPNLDSKIDIGIIRHSLEMIFRFSSQLASEWDFVTLQRTELKNNKIAWNFLKICLFSVSLSLQGYISWLLLDANRKIFNAYAPEISSLIIRTFSNLYFIVVEISMAGFPAFDFVYYSAMDILLDPKFGFEEISSIANELSDPIKFMPKRQLDDYIAESLVTRAKTIYLLNLYELLVPLASQISSNKLSVIKDFLPLAQKFLSPPDRNSGAGALTPEYYHPVLESAHSVILSIITLPAQSLEHGGTLPTTTGIMSLLRLKSDIPNPQFYIIEEISKTVTSLIPDYFALVMSLFPNVLTPAQCKLAIVTIVRAISPPSPIYRFESKAAEKIICELIEKSDEVGVGVPVPKKTHHLQIGNDNQEHNPNMPPTIRAVILSSVIHSIPFLEIAIIEKYMGIVWNRIGKTSSRSMSTISVPIIFEEQQFLEVDMFNMISGELDQQKSSLGIRWWYQKSSL